MMEFYGFLWLEIGIYDFLWMKTHYDGILWIPMVGNDFLWMKTAIFVITICFIYIIIFLHFSYYL
jgi:hypothetical protein